MADAKKSEDAGEGEVPKKKSKLLLMIIIGVLVLVLGGGGAAFFLMKKSADADEEDPDAEETPKSAKAKAKKKKDAPKTPPVFSKLEPFVVKLQSEGQENYVQAIPELKLHDPLMVETLKGYMPEIRHKVLLILAGKKASELSTPEGMQILANQIRVTINAILSGEPVDPALEKQNEAADDAPVQAVFFSSLIVQ